jgi:hypothetical protein
MNSDSGLYDDNINLVNIQNVLKTTIMDLANLLSLLEDYHLAVSVLG